MATKVKPITTASELDAAAAKAKSVTAKKDRTAAIEVLEQALKSTDSNVLAAAKSLKAKFDAGQLSDEVLTGLASGALLDQDFKGGKWTRADSVGGYPATRKRIEAQGPAFAQMQDALVKTFEADGLKGVFDYMLHVTHYTTATIAAGHSALEKALIETATVANYEAEKQYKKYLAAGRFVAGLNALSAELNAKKAPAKKSAKPKA